MPATPLDFITGEEFGVWLQEMAAQKRVESTQDAATLLGISHDTVLRTRKRGGDKMLALACAALLKRINPYKPAPGLAESLPPMPVRKRGRPAGATDKKPRKTREEWEAEKEAEIRAKLRAEMGLPPEEPAVEATETEPETVAA